MKKVSTLAGLLITGSRRFRRLSERIDDHDDGNLEHSRGAGCVGNPGSEHLDDDDHEHRGSHAEPLASLIAADPYLCCLAHPPPPRVAEGPADFSAIAVCDSDQGGGERPC